RPDTSLSAMLASGEVDAVMSARAPDAFVPGGTVARLFPSYRAEEERFFKRTGIFPIMHLITMRRAVFEQHPWAAMNLFKMFDEANPAALPAFPTSPARASRFPGPRQSLTRSPRRAAPIPTLTASKRAGRRSRRS